MDNWLIMAAAATLLFASDDRPSASDEVPRTPRKWTRHSGPTFDGHGTFSMAMPPSMRGGPVQGIDSYVAEYRSADLELDIDYGWYGDSRACETAPRCSIVKIDGVDSSRAFYEGGDGEDMRSHIFYYIPVPAGTAGGRNVTSLAIAIRCSTRAACASADAIVSTVDLIPLP